MKSEDKPESDKFHGGKLPIINDMEREPTTLQEKREKRGEMMSAMLQKRVKGPRSEERREGGEKKVENN